jgi:flagellar hook-basal body complex protein FliE
MSDPISAARAYLDAARAGQAARSGAAQEGGGVAIGAGDFSQLIGNVLSQAQAAGRASEAQSVAALSGKADVVDVVTAVSAAEASLETVLAVRDEVIRAYQEILRMPI